ncbi:hypothetical protein ICL16_43840 [Iningainema sp. BLCCT55]|uniref:Uncharacterized protein n=1 Tax=Iningainema tapete BLCC-T55 TaxID=2748662 RepID=A0A8J7CA25_9CYAN|nr:hypothetical protein [Iningainema tapete BLCC-T55]
MYQTTSPRTTFVEPPNLNPWLRVQALNVTRHAAALRPFRHNEFGIDPASPSDAHIDAVNQLILQLRSHLQQVSKTVAKSADEAIHNPDTALLQKLISHKDRAHNLVRAIEQIWDFYFELFGQRQSQFGNWLLACDRIALDCYQYIYMGLGKARSIPAPAPFSYMKTGFSPATFRRGIPLTKLSQQINPFPLIQLPYHRLVNPWTLGAILHEVSHNLQTDLKLRQKIPHAIAKRLMQAGMSKFVAATWTRWHSETFADMSGLLLGGPYIVASLMDIASRSPQATLHFHPGAPHPIPYLRVFISTELLRRMGFLKAANNYNSIWQSIYPNPRAGNIPEEILATFSKANRLVVDTICYTPYDELGGKTLAEVTGFKRQHQLMIDEAGERLAAGNDPGIIPERFLIGASRSALDRRLAEPKVITQNFYKALARR